MRQCSIRLYFSEALPLFFSNFSIGPSAAFYVCKGSSISCPPPAPLGRYMICMVGTKTHRKRRRPVEEWGSFLFAIETIHSHYSFGDGSRLDHTAFSEYFHPQLDATCLAPEKYKGRLTRFTLIGDRLNERDLKAQASSAEKHSAGVGTLTFRGEQSDYLGSVPFDTLWNVISTSLAGGFRFIYLHGAAMKRGTARIKSIGFYEEFDLDDV